MTPTPKNLTKWIKPGLTDKFIYFVYELNNGKWEPVKKLGTKNYSKHYADVYGIFFTP
jgi:hypothetical protein